MAALAVEACRTYMNSSLTSNTFANLYSSGRFKLTGVNKSCLSHDNYDCLSRKFRYVIYSHCKINTFVVVVIVLDSYYVDYFYA